MGNENEETEKWQDKVGRGNLEQNLCSRTLPDTKIVHARFYLGKALAPFWFILTPLIEVAVVFLRSNPFLAPFL